VRLRCAGSQRRLWTVDCGACEIMIAMIPGASALAFFLSLWRINTTVYAQERNATASTELDVNFLISSYECSHHGKEWRICTQPNAWGSMFYCPAYSEYNETELAKPEWADFGVFTPLMPCFTCPGSDSNCSQVVKEVLTANNIGEDQNSTLMGTNIWKEALGYCVELCEMNKLGEACNQDSQCTPGALFCDYAADDTKYTNGKCRACPTNPVSKQLHTMRYIVFIAMLSLAEKYLTATPFLMCFYHPTQG
jgi:hypothetical protein